MTEYVRPELPVQVFHDDAGNVIEYGRRWRDGTAPENTYSVTSHPERFQPLHTIADALIEHLTQDYDVTVNEDLRVAADLQLVLHHDVSRAVRLTPANNDGAPLTFVFTTYPGVVLHAGLLHDFPFPDCGCDACDLVVEGVDEELENTVFAVVAGRYAEKVDDASSLNVGYEMRAPDGSRWQRGSRMERILPEERLRLAASRLQQLPEGRWQPWARRS